MEFASVILAGSCLVFAEVAASETALCAGRDETANAENPNGDEYDRVLTEKGWSAVECCGRNRQLSRRQIYATRVVLESKKFLESFLAFTANCHFKISSCKKGLSKFWLRRTFRS